ncbi:hypothetical protein [Nostoc flagelliforme]|uniref:hypothetical protein n=1 Tax=Nostoc flagelliforme TaxID=1306274 RepID=UPI0016896455|nr:hypothetical protein [Nostoc flagelliforme]
MIGSISLLFKAGSSVSGVGAIAFTALGLRTLDLGVAKPHKLHNLKGTFKCQSLLVLKKLLK